MYEILIVDDEKDICNLTSDILSDAGYRTRTATNSDTALAAVDERVPAAILLDIWLQGSELDGLGVLELILRKYNDIPIIVMSGHGNIETAVSALKLGAYDYLEKPFKEDKLLWSLKNAIDKSKLKRENAELKFRSSFEDVLIGESSVILRLRSLIQRVAPTKSRVLITGPAGCGKEVVARMIHAKSIRANSPFITVNAASISSENFEEELFGTEESGHFGNPRKVGLVEKAHGGTLYLDEIADLSLATQGKILRILQEQTFNRIGSGRSVEVDVRIISASSENLLAAIQDGRLREDLYYRLNVVPIQVPSLTERRDDIPVLCEYFLKRASQTTGLPERDVSMDALVAMQTYDWPGNVRQLRNVIEWLLIMSPENAAEKITSHMLPPEILGNRSSAGQFLAEDILCRPLRDAREVFEREYITAQLKRFKGNVSRTATFIGMERSALHRKLRLLDLVQEELEA
ncbi:MAG: sigma-54-dependent Fis family transcriptional regulator [Alphaproteobacteria bacterium]|nr:sigma-54-dependent Fis family transcriptional regulator [Alphaproteobacteria bacterium]